MAVRFNPRHADGSANWRLLGLNLLQVLAGFYFFYAILTLIRLTGAMPFWTPDDIELFGLVRIPLWLAAIVALCISAALFLWTRSAAEDANAAPARSLETRQTVLMAQMRETAAQEERNRLARDLHDTIKQQLFSINVAAATAQSLRGRDDDAAYAQVAEVRVLSQAAMVEMKALLAQLRPQPLAAQGLVQAIKEQLEALHFRSNVQVAFVGDSLPDDEQFPAGAQSQVFRAVQEALGNVARHARASHVNVTLRHDARALSISVVDDGQGFDPKQAATGMGLGNMHSRMAELGGTATLASSPGAGTRVELGVPLIPRGHARHAELARREERLHSGYVSSLLAGFVMIALAVGTGFMLWFGYRADVTAQMMTLAVTSAVCLPLLFGAVSMRRRSIHGDEANPLWRIMVRAQTMQQVLAFAFLGVWLLVALRLSPWLVIAALSGVVLLCAAHVRDVRLLDTRLEQWAAPSWLRTRRNENLFAIGTAIVFVLIFGGGYINVMHDVQLYPESMSQWFGSFFMIGYPFLFAIVIPFTWMLFKWERRSTRDTPVTELITSTRSLRGTRCMVGIVGLLFLEALVICAMGLLGPTGNINAAWLLGLASALLIFKMWHERKLTTQIREWSNLMHQRLMLSRYRGLLLFSIVGILSAAIGAAVGWSTGDMDPAAGRLLPIPSSPQAANVGIALVAVIIGILPMSALMLHETQRRIARLKGAG